MWYTCINHVRVVGKPLYNFVPALGCQPCGAEGALSTGASLRPSIRLAWLLHSQTISGAANGAMPQPRPSHSKVYRADSNP